MSEVVKAEHCTGCMACLQSCPKGCITIHEDSYGNMYPIIDDERCVKCNKCKLSCPSLHMIVGNVPQRAYAVWSRSPKIREAAASGGAATEFYHHAIESGWWICGTEFGDGFCAIHTVSNDVNIIEKYRQSKYVYSESLNVYRQIRDILNRNENVLFISLPCKVAGLLSYLGKKYENLVTVDIVCHGTPPYQFLKEHICAVASQGKSDFLRFRKDNEFFFELEANGVSTYTKEGRTDSYLAAFLEGLDYRQSCYECNWAKRERVSDLTICDFWGLGTKEPFNHPYTGSVSAVLVNTKVGFEFFDSCKKSFFVEERLVEEALDGNEQLNRPSKCHPKRKEFEELYLKCGFDSAVKTILSNEMREEEKRLKNAKRKNNLRKIAGVILKRYRKV